MLSLYNILSIALYEIKTLSRSWFFRIFSVATIVILIFLNTVLFITPQSAPWMLRGVSSSIPYMNLMLLNVVQAIIGIFMASDFFKYDRKLDSTQVIYMRSMTNADYVLGKAVGVCILFLFFNMLILILSFVFNMFFADVPVVFQMYLYYPLLIGFPTLVYIFGLSFISMAVLKSQAITFIILLGYIASTLFFLGGKFHHLFDYMAYQVPLLYSDFVGFGVVSPILIHRGMYLFLGLGFIFATVLFLKRLPQSVIMNRISLILSIAFIVGAGALGFVYVSQITSGKELRREMAALNKRAVEEPKAAMTTCHLELEHHGDTIAVTAEMTLENTSSAPLDTFIFSLNPGLTVARATMGDTDVEYTSNLHLVSVKPHTPLQPGDIANVTLSYHGRIDEEACYVDIDEDIREENYRLFLYNIDKRYAFITPDYVLLTPEALWYPSTGVPYGSAYPNMQSRDFVNYELTVSTVEDLTAVSQGAMERTGEGAFRFRPESPLPQISLSIGQYEHKSATVDSIIYNLYVLKGHDYFSQYFTTIGEKLTESIREVREDYERSINGIYPFKRFTVIEVPIQFYAYERAWTLGQEVVQPEQVLLPEKAVMLFSADFKRSSYWGSRHGRRDTTQTPEEMEQQLFRRFVQNTFITDFFGRRFSSVRRSMGRQGGLSFQRIFFSFLPSFSTNYNVFPNFFTFTTYFHSENYQIFNIILEHYLKGKLENRNLSFMRFIQGISSEELANSALAKETLPEILANPEKKDLVYDVLKMKSDYLFGLIKAEVGTEAFEEFLTEFIAEHMFRTVEVDDFIRAVYENFLLDLEPHLQQWYHVKELPAFLVTGLKCTEIIDFDATRYQVVFTVSNPESVEGLIRIGAMTGGGGRGMGRGMSFGDPTPAVEEFYILKAHQAKEIGMVLDQPPRVLQFNTYISQNIPYQFDRNPGEPQEDDFSEIFEGGQTLDELPRFFEPGEIIVDDEDDGFEILTQPKENAIKEFLLRDTVEEEFTGLNFWHPPSRWSAAVNNNSYGMYRHTTHFKKSGDGSQSVRWKADIPETGRYDVYYYTQNFTRQGMFRRRGRGRFGNRDILADLSFTVYHDDGTEEVTLDLKNTEAEWSYLGTYYFSRGQAKIELSDKSKGRIVYADAVKWKKK